MPMAELTDINALSYTTISIIYHKNAQYLPVSKLTQWEPKTVHALSAYAPKPESAMRFHSIKNKGIAFGSRLSTKECPGRSIFQSKDLLCHRQYCNILSKCRIQSRYCSFSSESPAFRMLSLDKVESWILSCNFIVVGSMDCTREIQSKLQLTPLSSRTSSVIVIRFCFCIREIIIGIYSCSPPPSWHVPSCNVCKSCWSDYD